MGLAGTIVQTPAVETCAGSRALQSRPPRPVKAIGKPRTAATRTPSLCSTSRAPSGNSPMPLHRRQSGFEARAQRRPLMLLVILYRFKVGKRSPAVHRTIIRRGISREPLPPLLWSRNDPRGHRRALDQSRPAPRRTPDKRPSAQPHASGCFKQSFLVVGWPLIDAGEGCLSKRCSCAHDTTANASCARHSPTLSRLGIEAELAERSAT